MYKVFLFFVLITSLSSRAQHNYTAPTDSLILKNLAQWQDLKF